MESFIVQSLAAQTMTEQDVAVLRVPSVVVPGEHCFVTNPSHPDFAQIRFEPAVAFEYDPRLIRERHR